MKSLLVDVLRQSQDDASDDERLRPLADERPEQLNPRTTEHGDVDNLDLMATGQYEAAVADPAKDQTEPPEDETEMPAAVGDSPVASKRGPLADTTALNKLGAKLHSRSPIVMRLGHMAPIFCLVSIVGVTGAYLAMDELTSGSLNEDLDELTELVQIDGANGAVEIQRARENAFGVASDVRELEPAPEPPVRDVNSRKVATATAASSGSQRSIAVDSIEVQRQAADAAAVEDNAYDLVVSGYAAYRQRDFKSAGQLYEQALLVEPNHRDALLGVAAVYQQTAREASALTAYRKVLQVDPGNTVAAAAVLSMRASGSQLNNESDIKLLLQRYPDAHHFHFALGSIYVTEQRWAEARRAFTSAYRLAPANANYSYNLAVSIERLGDLVEAVQYYEKALAYAGDDSNVDPAAIELHLSQLAIIARED